MTVVDHLLFALAWFSFGFLHSVLARQKANDAFDRAIGGFSRIAYNIAATVHLAAVLILEWRGFPGKAVFDLPPVLEIPMVALQATGWVLLFVALVQYDVGRFGGLTQAKVVVHRRGNIDRHIGGYAGVGQAPMQRYEPAEDLPHARLEPLVTHGVHRYVRHPLYTALFMVLWGRAFDEAALMTAVWGSLYLLIGTRYEERKLLRIYGEEYARYMAAVPRFLPVRGKAWAA